MDDFDAALQNRRIKGAENVKVDLNAEEEDIENLEAFAKELVAKFNILAIKSHPDLFNLYGSLFIAFMEEFFGS